MCDGKMVRLGCVCAPTVISAGSDAAMTANTTQMRRRKNLSIFKPRMFGTPQAHLDRQSSFRVCSQSLVPANSVVGSSLANTRDESHPRSTCRWRRTDCSCLYGSARRPVTRFRRNGTPGGTRLKSPEEVRSRNDVAGDYLAVRGLSEINGRLAATNSSACSLRKALALPASAFP